MSEIKVNKISPRTACGTTTLGDSGDTFTIPAGATITNSGTASGFGRTGTVDWITTPKVTGDSPVTAVTGKGYFLNTTSGTITINLPAGAAGSIVSMADYARSWDTYNVTVTPNGSEKIGGTNASATLDTEGQSVTFVYVDSTQGWLNIQDSTSNVTAISYITATGGNAIVTCGNFKTHIFTGPGTFCVSALGAGQPLSNNVEYLVIAGAGGGGMGSGYDSAGGGGAGGFRTRTALPGASPLNAPANLTITATSFPITVGGGGNGTTSEGSGNKGANSTFSSITSAGGGFGRYGPTPGPGGSGGGSHQSAGGTGNDPPVSPPQGQNGGNSGCGPVTPNGGGGGGAGAVGASGVTANGGPGGAGSFIPTGFIGPTAPSYGETGPAGRYFAGGGAGGNSPSRGGQGCGTGGLGGGGDSTQLGLTNMGGGGGASDTSAPGGRNGGSGIVIIRYQFQ